MCGLYSYPFKAGMPQLFLVAYSTFHLEGSRYQLQTYTSVKYHELYWESQVQGEGKTLFISVDPTWKGPKLLLKRSFLRIQREYKVKGVCQFLLEHRLDCWAQSRNLRHRSKYRHMKDSGSKNPQYSYSFFTPHLCLKLLFCCFVGFVRSHCAWK